MGRNAISLERPFRSCQGFQARLFDRLDPTREFGILAADWDRLLPARTFLRSGMTAVKAAARDKGGRPIVWQAESLFGLVLVQERLGINRKQACIYVANRTPLRRLFGFPPNTSDAFPDPDAVRRFEKAWAERLHGDLSDLRRLAYIDTVADDLVKWKLPLDRVGIDNRPCLSPQRRPNKSIHRSRRDEGSGPILIRHRGKEWTENGRLRTSAISDSSHVIASRCLHDQPGEMLTEPDLYRRVLIPETLRNYDELRRAVIERGGIDPRSRRPLTFAGDNACNNAEMLLLLREHGCYGAFRAPAHRTCVGKVAVRRFHPTPGDPLAELREACDDGAWLCPCTSGIGLDDRPPMTRRLRGRGEMLVSCERGCVHIGKVFVVPRNPRVHGTRRSQGGDPRLSNPLPPYDPRVAAVNFVLKEAVEHHNGTLLREHGLGVKARAQCHRFLWGQFAHDLHYMLTDALRNFDVSRNLDRLGGPGPVVPWEVAEESAMRNHHAVGNRTGNPRSTTGWHPSPAAARLRIKLQAELAKREAAALPAHEWATEWLRTQGLAYAALLDYNVPARPAREPIAKPSRPRPVIDAAAARAAVSASPTSSPDAFVALFGPGRGRST